MSKFKDKSSVINRLKDGYYESKLKYPKGNSPINQIAKTKYVQDMRRLEDEFENDLYRFFKVEFHHNKKLCFNIAGQLSNYDKNKIFIIFEKLVLLIKDK